MGVHPQLVSASERDPFTCTQNIVLQPAQPAAVLVGGSIGVRFQPSSAFGNAAGDKGGDAVVGIDVTRRRNEAPIVTSGLSWLDTSREDQARMRELLNLFSESETQDELGIGQVRDAFSDKLFPGTSTLHTRARYLLIVPWCYREAEQRGLHGAALSSRVELTERKLIGVAKNAGYVDGLIGRVAGVAVKTLPSTIYWGALAKYQIRLTDAPGSLVSQTASEVEELVERTAGDWSPTLPSAPAEFPWSLDGGLDLGGDEAAWLRDRMRLGSAGSLLDHFLQDGQRPGADSYAAWMDATSKYAPAEALEDMRHAERFSVAMHGALLLYNLIVGERYEAQKLDKVQQPVVRYEEALEKWLTMREDLAGWQTWDRAAMWGRVKSQNPRISNNLRVQAFVDAWLDAVVSGRVADFRTDQALRSLIQAREQAVKRLQSRFVNDKLLRTWSGSSGVRQYNFRWTQVRRLLTDIHDGLEVRGASS